MLNRWWLLNILLISGFVLYGNAVSSWCLKHSISSSERVWAIDYSPDGSMLAYALQNSTVRIIDAFNYTLKFSFAINDKADSIKFNPTNTLLLVGTQSNMIHIFRLSNNTLINITAGQSKINAIDFLKDSSIFVTCGDSNEVKIWNGTTFAFISSIPDQGILTVNDCQFTDNNSLIVSDSTGKVTIINPPYTSLLSPVSQVDYGTNIICIGNRYTTMDYIAGDRQTSKVWQSFNSTAAVYTTTSSINTCSYSRTLDYFMVAGDDMKVSIFNATDKNNTLMQIINHGQKVLSSDFSNDGVYLAVGDDRLKVGIYSLYCTPCNASYYFSSISKQCESCSYFTIACQTCSSQTLCSACLQGFFLTPNKTCAYCNQSIANCSTCNSSTYCTSAYPGFYVNNGLVLRCENALTACVRCNSSTVCTECQSGYYLGASNVCYSCTALISNCLFCSNTSCTVCRMGYYKTGGGTCAACSIGCADCQSATICNNCTAGYSSDGTGGCVQNNNSTNNTNTTNGTCTGPAPYLDLSSNSCVSSCPAGSAPNNQSACQSCHFSCQTCTNFSICLSCSPSSNRYLNGTQCLPSSGYFENFTANASLCLLANCMQCTSEVNCIICVNNYFLDGSGGCVQNNNSTNTTNGTCTGPAPYLDLSSNSCVSSCPAGSSPNNQSVCQSCHFSCQTCTNFSICLSCSPSSNRYLNGTQCLPSSGYFENFTANASLCLLANCMQCTSEVNCIICVNNYFLDGSGGCVQNNNSTNTTNGTCASPTPYLDLSSNSCVSSCPAGSSPNNQSACQPCHFSCQTCTNFSICLSCSPSSNRYLNGAQCIPYYGYYENFTTNASQCLFPCAGCLNQLECLSCFPGYFLNASSCIQCFLADCVACSSQFNCVMCRNGFTLDGSGGCTQIICGGSSPFLDMSSNSCVSSCPAGSFPNNQSLCQSCHFSCQSCTNYSQCLSCSPSSNRYLNGTQCLPSPGFFQDFTTNVVPCASPCLTCTSLSSCTACIAGFYLSAASCLPCSIPDCVQCSSSTICTSCSPNYRLNSSSLCELSPCTDPFCTSCPSSNSFCEICQPNYVSSDGTCKPICGDFMLVASQQCDDGNLIDNDGCSSSCSVQTDFSCTGFSTGSACSYTGRINITEIYMEKIDNENKISIKLDVQPKNLSLWDTTTLQQMLVIDSNAVQSFTVEKNTDGTYSVIVSYNSDIQGQPIGLRLVPSRSNNPLFMNSVTADINLVVNPDNNKGAYFYSESTYQMAAVISTISTCIFASSVFFFVIGLICGKMVGVELMGVMQISFFSLMTLSQVNPVFAALSQLRFINGYNSLSTNHLADELTPTSPKGIFLFSRFTENFNFTLAIILIPLLVALISFILSKTALKNNQKIVLVAQRAVGEYTLMGILFSGYLTAVSFALQMMYGMKNMEDLLGKVSLVECIILLLLSVGYFVFLLLKPEFFGEFVQEFKKDRLSSKYYNFIIVQRLLVGSSLIFLLSVNVSAAIPMAVFVLIGVYTMVRKPYKNQYHNYRVFANMLVSVLVLAIYLAYSLISPSQRNKMQIFNYLPLIVCCLLLVCVVYNGAAIIYGIYKWFKQEKTAQEMHKYGADKFKQLHQDTIVEDQTNVKYELPKSRFMSHVPQNGRDLISIQNIKKQLMKINIMKKDENLAAEPKKMFDVETMVDLDNI